MQSIYFYIIVRKAPPFVQNPSAAAASNGTWDCNLPPFAEIMTASLTNQPTKQPTIHPTNTIEGY